jgi:hypothetical protein
MSDQRSRPLRLKAAASLYFGANAGVTGRTLYRASRPSVPEAERLIVYEIARKLFTTLDDVADWVARQRARPAPSAKPMAPPASVEQSLMRAKAMIEAVGVAAVERL